ncbi:MAG TPA: amino acid permease [Candidatus Acidoferrales bacterium]|nr:amino acid permease [Candidatus Acidoferrales bacterium]
MIHLQPAADVHQVEQPRLAERLNLSTAIAVVIGSIIGSGIFLVPQKIAATLGDAGWIIAVWVFGGLLSLAGALTSAEIAGMIPAAGGQYVYFREIYNGFTAFLYGWTTFIVYQTGSIAAIAVAFAKYLGFFFPQLGNWNLNLGMFVMPEVGIKLAAICAILFVTIVNYFGVQFGGFVQQLFTYLKVLAITGIVISCFIFGTPAVHLYAPFFGRFHGTSLIGAFGIALVSVLWAYDGWNSVTYLAGEVKNAQRNIPVALVSGTITVIVIYVLANLAYMYVLSISQIAGSKLVASDAISIFFGKNGAAMIAVAVMISAFGTVNATTMTTARVYFAMARDKLFFSRISDVHPKYKTPHVSLVVQGIWASLLTLTGTYDQLLTYVIFASWLFYALGTFGIFILRKKRPDAERPYRTIGYPFVPLIFVIVSVWFVYNTIVTDPRDSLVGLGLVLLGLPAYWYWHTRNAKR